MESLQLAQMLADLSDLNAAVGPFSRRQPPWPGRVDAVTQEPEAAAALVNANKTLSQSVPTAVAAPPAATSTSEHGALKPLEQRNHHRVQSASATASRTASPARFDSTQIGRRLLTPPITRSNSAQGSVPGTPRRESTEVRRDRPAPSRRARSAETECDPQAAIAEGDIDRASTLMALYDIRAKLKQQQDNSSLMKAREKIAALAARQQAQMLSVEKNQAAPARHTQYTYPKSSPSTPAH